MTTENKSASLLAPATIVVGSIGVIAIGLALYQHAHGSTNQIALDSKPKSVTTITAKATTFQPTHRYVGTIEPWVSARIGPQLVSAYVQTVLVRPGTEVKRGQVVATLDCRNTSAANKSIAEQAKAVQASQMAVNEQAARVRSLLDGGFASADEAEMKTAESAKQQAQFLSLQAQSVGTELQVSDCILRAPFDGEVSERSLDPGAFVHPGDAIVTVLDRSVLRITADAPEEDFDDVAKGSPLSAKTLATGATVSATISRRSPSADSATRTIHFEADIVDKEHRIPSGSTAELSLAAGKPKPATEIPLVAASVKQDNARLFVVAGGVAHEKVISVLGEREGSLFVDPSLAAESQVVTEGRLALVDGDKVTSLSVAAGATP